MVKGLHQTSVLEAGTGPELEMRLLGCLRERGAHTMDQLTALFPTVSWSQVFLAVDRLSRAGSVSLRRLGAYEYLVLSNRRD